MALLTSKNGWLVPTYAAFLWAVPLLYTVSGYLHSAHDFARIAQSFLLLCTAVVWAKRMHSPPPNVGVDFLPPRRQLIVGTVVLILLAASIWQSANPIVALREVTLFAALCTAASAVRYGIRDEIHLTVVLRVLVVGTLMYSLAVAVVLCLSLVFGTMQDPWTALIGFDNPRFLNHSQTVALPLVAVVSAGDREARWRRIAWCTLFMSGTLLFITFGRATLLALFVGLVTGWLTFGRRGRGYIIRTLPPALLGLAAMWVCYLLWLQPAGFNIDTRELVSQHYRGYLISEAVHLWWTSPWLGVGPMHFAHWYNGEAAHPHNIYAQLLAEYGAPLAVIALVGAFVWLRSVHTRLRRAADVPLAMGLWGAVIGIAVDGAFSGNFVMPLPQLWIALAFGLTEAVLHLKTPITRQLTAVSSASSAGWHGARWLIVALVVCFAVQTTKESKGVAPPRIHTSGPVGNPESRTPVPNPRFWSNGWF